MSDKNIAWIFSACGACIHCQTGNENLCEQFKATGRDVHHGYAEYTTVSEDFAQFQGICFCEESERKRFCQGARGLLGWRNRKTGARKARLHY